MHRKYYCLAAFSGVVGGVAGIVTASQRPDPSTSKLLGGAICFVALVGSAVLCSGITGDKPVPTITRDEFAALLKALPGDVSTNLLQLAAPCEPVIAALHKLRLGLLIYVQHLDDAATPKGFFYQLLGFIDGFMRFCPRNGAKLIGAITTQSLNARDGYEKASREVYFWCVSALPLLDSFIDALQHEHTDDAQTLLLAVYENGATIMRTVALALATTEKQLTGAKANVIALSSTCLATDSSETPVKSAPATKRLTAPDATTARAVSLVQFDNLVALAEAKTLPPVMEASSTLATLLLGLAHQIESMVQAIRSDWQQLAQTNVIHEIESEMRQPKLLQLLDEATIEAYITSAKALKAACNQFMEHHRI
ncbi:hypothetical protein SPRG_20514 [Saprolegnia parasitica CBS 223.65]|uniref:Uncharacterized protein n=1 Tax=Saprolegnia parasitica (strain CBS 223.65) TaxID=695850 RepID=A0A067CJM0_SAPPC|nr:hypothetical protein SPRG_20514 [Saprolegnia parasitica CBS 223.65]KDO26716.1 hypothetical protein SPRG_20514 [Saprolegnia parasitica CBS 223.65]|eukprot:XP_012202600.1 hypothetical protein SPRG_20514 [Saprolegnia parasitica CBS 223.65]